MKISLRKSLLTLGALFSFLAVSAQTVTGNVSDASGPLPGATVLVKGTTNGTQTDFDGNYTLNNVPSDAVIQVSYIGYRTVEKAVNGASTLDFVLSEDAQALDEVVIIGYGSTTVKDATGSVAAVTSEDFNRGVIASPEELIQGKTAGVQITQQSGEPGAGVEFRIRGTNSVRSNNNPLFVVDGIPLSGGGVNAGTDVGLGGAGSRNPLNFLNPQDIESISILKDASATAIYGSRGANGVVIITTKSGRGSSGGVFEFSSNLAISSPAQEYDLLDRNTFLSAVTQYGGDAALQDFGNSTDWQDVVTRTAASTVNQLSYSNTYKDGNVRSSFSYGKQFGILENSALERITGRVNAQHRFLDDKLTVGLQGTISRVNDERAPVNGGAGFQGDLLGAAYSANPTWPNNPNFDAGGQLNPANLLAYSSNLSNTDRILVNGSFDYKFTDEFSAKLNLGLDESKGENVSVLSEDLRGLGNNSFGNGRGNYVINNSSSRLMEFTVNYKTEAGDLSIDALAGYSYQDFRFWGAFTSGFGFSSGDLGEMGQILRDTYNGTRALIDGSFQNYGYNFGGDLTVNRLVPNVVSENIANTSATGLQSFTANTYDNTDELQSFFARVNVGIADKFLITGTFRADGSSRFGGDNQYGFFPSGAIAWNLHNEDFVGDAFSTLKIRVGAGITGNQEGLGYGNFLRRQRWGDFGIDNGGNVVPTGLVTVTFANPGLQWEETTDYNVGLDFGLNNDRISGTVNVYRKETSNLLLNLQAAQPSPQPFFFENITDGTVLNQGVEFNIDVAAVETEDFDFGAGFNIAYNYNEFQDFPGLIPAGTIRGQGLTGAFAQVLTGGAPLFSYYLREFNGFDANGQPDQVDIQQLVGADALPDFVGGLSLSGRYKNFDFAAYFTGQFGFSVYNNTANAFFTAGAIANGRNVTPDILTNGESGTAAADVSTRFLESGDFVRFQNLSVGYNWPISGDGPLKSLRLSVTGQNLFLITDYSGLDPEISSQVDQAGLLNGLPTAGIDYTAFPRPRTITFGLNATF